MDKLYLAGPFFNPKQVALIESIEKLFASHGVPIFSPRLQNENKKGPPNAEDAKKIFGRNIEALDQCDGVLAVLDWLMPDKHQLRVVHDVPWLANTEKYASPPLSLPDTGTVWEMGYAFHAGTPIAIYTQRTSDQPLNLMLTQGAHGVVRGLDRLDTWIKDALVTDQFDFEMLEQWTGGNR